MIIYEDTYIYIEKEVSEVPWVKIFTKEPYKELGDVPKALRVRLWEVYDVVEDVMRHHYNPDKINMASFANMLPRVHIHVMARFKHDSYFPNPMWGEKLRESSLIFKDEEVFHKKIFNSLNEIESKY